MRAALRPRLLHPGAGLPEKSVVTWDAALCCIAWLGAPCCSRSAARSDHRDRRLPQLLVSSTRPAVDGDSGPQLPPFAKQRTECIRIRGEEGAQLCEGAIVQRTRSAKIRAYVPSPLPVQHEAREGAKAKETGDTPKSGTRSGSELVKCEDEHLLCRERVEPEAQLRLVNGLANDARVQATRHGDTSEPRSWRQPLERLAHCEHGGTTRRAGRCKE